MFAEQKLSKQEIAESDMARDQVINPSYRAPLDIDAMLN